MSSGATAQDDTWKAKEQGDEARYIREKEQAQLAEIRNKSSTDQKTANSRDDIEGGYGGQEDLEDRYATTSGEH
ncbi:hypothetical protein SISNIDRAFT_480708 [Sistotremastrum niveocremeum HHB9708]|uniref:ATPase inhibitor, mitochondrial n=2 Tax=Sistotremastraceae TaxID=3402574 RepID=A0A165AK16_9AGAM|nr:hypothetical protein SISNIDRAFT_480708 [Sistotremastrum niveocremeum HHB9708]KZT43979.1 hypothetical protein SISSUDRAFT_1056996 [Sistotremastrum suecicum HHB10207 ss-3]